MAATKTAIKSLAQQIAPAAWLKRFPNASQHIIGVRVQDYVRHGELALEIGNAHYGIEWARETSRVSGIVELAIRKLTGREYAALIAEVTLNTSEIGDVPRYLNMKFAA